MIPDFFDTRAERRAYLNELADGHGIEVSVDVMTLSQDHIGRIDPKVIDGQINVDVTGQVSRSATAQFLDPRRTLNFDSNSPDAGALYLDRMLRFTYAVIVPGVGRIECPVFTGPVSKLDRDDDLVNVECQGKEVLGMGAAWDTLTIKKGTPKVDAIRRIMQRRGGETLFDLPDFENGGPKLKETLSLGRMARPWLQARKIAKSMDRQLFYDARGRCRLRKIPENPVFIFYDAYDDRPKTSDPIAARRATLVSSPQISYTTENLKNTVHVKGGKPKGSAPTPKDKKDATTGTGGKGYNSSANEKEPLNPPLEDWFVAPPDHAFSPRRLGRDIPDPDHPNQTLRVPRHLVEVVENSKLRSKKEVNEAGRNHLKRLLREQVEISFDALPVPFLDERDMVYLDTERGGFELVLKQFSLPLSHSGVMSVGYNKPVSVRRRRIRR